MPAVPLQLGWTEISDTPAWDKRSFEIEITNITALEPLICTLMAVSLTP